MAAAAKVLIEQTAAVSGESVFAAAVSGEPVFAGAEQWVLVLENTAAFAVLY